MKQSAASQLLAAPMLDPAAVDLDGADRVVYVLQQRFRYEYDGPVTDLDHRLMAVPRARHGSTRRVLRRVTASCPVGAQPLATVRPNAAGNVVARIRVARVPESVEFGVLAVLERTGPVCDDVVPVSALTDPRMLRPTRLTAPDAALRDVARDLAGPDPVETAERFCAYVHGAIAYGFGVTSVSTPAAQALAGGRGVCQDHAHVMLALCHAAGLPARYVSGHLLGIGGTHAWVEVLVPDRAAASGRSGGGFGGFGAGPGSGGPRGARALAFDPCNGRRAGATYVTVAVGRDYADVAPTSGTYEGPAAGRLTCSKRVGVAAVA